MRGDEVVGGILVVVLAYAFVVWFVVRVDERALIASGLLLRFQLVLKPKIIDSLLGALGATLFSLFTLLIFETRLNLQKLALVAIRPVVRTEGILQQVQLLLVCCFGHVDEQVKGVHNLKEEQSLNLKTIKDYLQGRCRLNLPFEQFYR